MRCELPHPGSRDRGWDLSSLGGSEGPDWGGRGGRGRGKHPELGTQERKLGFSRGTPRLSKEASQSGAGVSHLPAGPESTWAQGWDTKVTANFPSLGNGNADLSGSGASMASGISHDLSAFSGAEGRWRTQGVT